MTDIQDYTKQMTTSGPAIQALETSVRPSVIVWFKVYCGFNLFILLCLAAIGLVW